MKLLQRIDDALTSPAAESICLQQFSVSNVLRSSAVTEHAGSTLASLKELLVAEHGIKMSSLTDAEIERFVKDEKTQQADSLTAAEYQGLMCKLVKYAALKAQRSPLERWILGVSLSAAAALAISAVLPIAAASAGLALAAAPVGAAVGAIAVGIDNGRRPSRDKKRATRHAPRKQVPAGEGAAAAPATPEQQETEITPETTPEPAVPATAAQESTADDSTAADEEQATAVGETEEKKDADATESADYTVQAPAAASTGSEDLVGAAVDVPPTPEVSAVSPFSKESLVNAGFPVTATAALAAEDADVPASSAVADMADSAEDSAGLPELVRSATPDAIASAEPDCISPVLSSARPSIEVPMFDDLIATNSAQLPPIATKKKSSGAKAIKKSLSKSYKNMKKALSLSSSGSLEAAAAAAVDAADGSITTPSGKPPKMGFLRRSFSRDSANMSDTDSATNVQISDGSATMRKMKEALRRSFDLKPRKDKLTSRVSMDSAHGMA